MSINNRLYKEDVQYFIRKIEKATTYEEWEKIIMNIYSHGYEEGCKSKIKSKVVNINRHFSNRSTI